MRPPTKGSVAMASITGVDGLDFVDVSMTWKASSRELGSIERNFKGLVCDKDAVDKFPILREG